MSDKETFHFLGYNFQQRLIAQVLTDTKFGESIIDILLPEYFKENKPLLVMMQIIKSVWVNEEVLLQYDTLQIRINKSPIVDSEMFKEVMITTLTTIQELNINDYEDIQRTAMAFCKQKALKKAIIEIDKIIQHGTLDDHYKCEEIIKQALEVGDNKDNAVNVFDSPEEALRDDFRKPIPTGIELLDEYMDGGLSRGELGCVLAPLGIGKSTMITKIANTAQRLGYNVVQIFFEDSEKIIQRKHFACYTGIDINDLSKNKLEVIDKLKKMKNLKGDLRLKKFPSDSTTMPIIKQYLRKLTASGFKPDLVLLDYIDCVVPSKHYADALVGEGSVMRQFETLAAEMNFAAWCAIQGNRGSLTTEVVDTHQMGGSIRKAQIGHFILSIARSKEQKEVDKATLAILKSRFGRDGIVFADSTFNNKTLEIVIKEAGVTSLELDKSTSSADQERVNNILFKTFNNVREKIAEGQDPTTINM